MNFWTLDSIRHGTASRWVTPPALNSPAPKGVSIDSRAVTPGQVFFAIKGENHDGHDHAAQAAQHGAAMIVAERPIAGLGQTPIALVPSTRRALLALAAAYRATLKARVIAVCGSNGKTTTVRLLQAALGHALPGHRALKGTASVKSFNNEIGVPLTILGAAQDDDFLICEVGSNAPGEIAALGGVVKPDIALITSIGREHLEGFKDLEGVAREEASIIKHLRPGGLAVLPIDAPTLRPYASCAARVVWFGCGADAEYQTHAISQALTDAGPTMRFTASTPDAPPMEVTMPLAGAHNASAALAAMAVACELGLSPGHAAAGLSTAAAPEMRLNISAIGATTRLINDAYNANPESTLAAIATAVALAAHRKLVLVLGDMLELGAAEGPAHAEVLAAAAATGGVVITVGVRYAAAIGGNPHAPGVTHAEAVASVDEGTAKCLAALVLSHADHGPALVLVKGSRGIRLERVCSELSRAMGSTPS